jgi:hypothetical protein
LTNVIGYDLFAQERKNMAADGDMFVQRKAWGFNRLCAAVCDNAPTEKLVEIEAQNVRNMLANGFAVPSFKVSIQQAFDILESLNTELGFESAGQRRVRLIETLHKIERDFIESGSATDVSKVIQIVALKFLASDDTCPSRDDFEKQCCVALGDFWMRRYGWELFAPYVIRRTHLNQVSYRQRSTTARQQAIPVISEIIRTAMNSPGGKLPKRKGKHAKQISHTPDGLKEELA